MISLKIGRRKVKVRSFKDMLVSEYFQMDSRPEVVKYIALQTGNEESFIMNCEMNPHVVGRINNIDVNNIHNCQSIKFKRKIYIDFRSIPFGVHYLSETLHLDKKDNMALWTFAIALNYKKTNNFNMSEVIQVYDKLMESKALDVIPTMNYFLIGYLKKKIFTRKNLSLFIRASPIIAKALALKLWSFITQKIKYKRLQK